MIKPVNKVITVGAALCLSLAAAACGSDDAVSEGTSTPAATEAVAGEGAEDTAAPAATASDETVVVAPDTATEVTVVVSTDVDSTDVDSTDVDSTEFETTDDTIDFTDISYPEFVPGDQIPGLTYNQSQVIHLIDQALDVEGGDEIDVDQDCLIEVVSRLSDADAQLIVEAGFEGDAELSEAGESLGDEASECIDVDDLSPTTT